MAVFNPIRLRRLIGHDGRVNDTIFQPASERVTPQQILVFFGGDVQDFPEAMQAHRDNKMYYKWNLENTARRLGRSFPKKHILVVKPSRIEYYNFSCYDNFVPSTTTGVPEHTPTHNSLQHLERLLQKVSERLKNLKESDLEPTSPTSLPEDIDIEDLDDLPEFRVPDPKKTNGAETSTAGGSKSALAKTRRNWDGVELENSRLTLVGFSKGCVVLNQLLYEFHYISTLTPCDAHATRFIGRIAEMYWLDGGHSGVKNTWITSRSLLETLTRLKIDIYIHVSSYQVLDAGRPWIGREQKTFTSLLKKLGAKVERYKHGVENEFQSLNGHFDVLGNFKRVQDESAPSTIDSDEDI